MAKVSIIVPVYNVEKYLRECLDSLINQTLSDIEIICINDGSNDNSLSILEEYARNDKRIKIINKENEGQGIARNIGIKEATGEYLAFVDSDDKCELNMYEVLYDSAKKYGADLVECSFKVYNDDTANIAYGKKLRGISFNKVFNWKNLFDKTLVFENIPSACTKLCKSALVKKNEILFGKGKFAEDAYFSLRMRVLSEKIVHIDEYFYTYRKRAGSTMATLAEQDFSNQIDLLLETRQFLEKSLCFKELEKGFEGTALGQLSTVHKYLPEDATEAYEVQIKKKLGDKIYRKYKRKVSKKFLKQIFTVGNKIINKNKVKVLTIFGFDIPLKKMY